MHERKIAVDDFKKAFGTFIQGKSVLVIDDVVDSAQTVSRMLYVNLKNGAKDAVGVGIGELSPPWWKFGQHTCPETGLQDPTNPEHIQKYGRFVCEQLPQTELMVHFRDKINSFADQIASAVRVKDE
ncbi:MAG: phosphoribosyltransferase [Candidatus Woesebacteria bacterium]